MNRKPLPVVPAEEAPRPGESFLERLHRRKTEARAIQSSDELADQNADVSDNSTTSEPPDPGDEDMPALDSLNPESDYAGFLSPRVSEHLRRAALRKLFHGSAFNVIDELDDYAEDFTTFETLGDIVTADMRHRIEVEAMKKAEEIKRALLDPDDDKAGPESDADSAVERQGPAVQSEHPLPDTSRQVTKDTATTTTMGEKPTDHAENR